MAVSSNLATEERLSWLRARLDADGSIQIAAAAAALDVSEMTIRRDLLELEGLGVVRRVRGGAVAMGPVSFQERHRTQARAKGRIAAKLRELVPASGAIGFDASSTILRLAGVLDQARDLVVTTNSIATFEALQGKPGINAVLTGGSLDPRTGSLVGPLACRVAGSLHLARLFVSAAAVDPTVGTSEAAIEEAEVKRVLASSAAEVIVAVDATKLGTKAMAPAIEWEHVTALVTDLSPDDRRLAPYRELTDVV